MFFEILITTLLACLVLWTFLSQKRPSNFPPGPIGIPIFGYLPFMGTAPHTKLGELGKKYGDVFSLYYGAYPIVVLNDIHSIREAFRKDVFSGRPNFLLAMKLSQDGITFNDGQAWYEQRRFTLKTLRDLGFGKQSMEKSVQEEVQDLVEHFRAKSNEPLELKYVFGLSVINALWAILAGNKFSLNDSKIQDIYQIVIEGFIDPEVAGSLWFLPWLAKIMPEKSGYNNVVKAVHSLKVLIREVLEEHKRTYHPGVFRDFMDVYLEKIFATTDPTSSFYKETGENNLIHVLIDLFTAGSDTLNTTLNFAILHMIRNPQIMRGVQLEIDTVVGLNRLPDVEDRKKMPYTEAVICEVLRHSSIVAGGILHSTTEDTKFLGYLLPKDTIVMPNLYQVHHDERTWGDPENFRPERFLEETNSGSVFVKNENLIPFSIGKRVCLAETIAQAEFFLFLTGLLQNFDFQPIPGQTPEYEVSPGLVLSPKPFKIIIKERP